MRRRAASVAALLLLASGGAAAARPAADLPRDSAVDAPAPQATAAAVAEPQRPRVAAGTGVWPLEPPVSLVRRFEPPADPWGPGHRGVDLQGLIGAPVRAALGGVVRHAAPVAGRGVVVVGHGATRTTYEPVTATVAVGDRVRAGDVLGRLAMAGSHCLPATCLHWGWRRGETYLDPLLLLGPRPVRLKPVDGPAGTRDAADRW